MTVVIVPGGPAAGLRLIDAGGVTVKAAVAEVEPLAALTVPTPGPGEVGTLNAAENAPAAVVLTVAGLVGTAVPLNVIVTAELAG